MVSGRLFAESSRVRPVVFALVCASLLAMLPDVDVFWVGLGVPDVGLGGHRGLTHTPAFAWRSGWWRGCSCVASAHKRGVSHRGHARVAQSWRARRARAGRPRHHVRLAVTEQRYHFRGGRSPTRRQGSRSSRARGWGPGASSSRTSVRSRSTHSSRARAGRAAPAFPSPSARLRCRPDRPGQTRPPQPRANKPRTFVIALLQVRTRLADVVELGGRRARRARRRANGKARRSRVRSRWRTRRSRPRPATARCPTGERSARANRRRRPRRRACVARPDRRRPQPRHVRTTPRRCTGPGPRPAARCLPAASRRAGPAALPPWARRARRDARCCHLSRCRTDRDRRGREPARVAGVRWRGCSRRRLVVQRLDHARQRPGGDLARRGISGQRAGNQRGDGPGIAKRPRIVRCVGPP